MATLLDLYKTIDALDIQLEAIKAVTQTADHIVDANRKQLLKGVKADGSSMPNYSPASVEMFGKPDGPIRLFDTGAFHDSFKVSVNSDGFEILANDQHDLEKKYSDDIYGLDPTSQEYYNELVFMPAFAANITEQTGLKFS